jgi:2-dehydro-3-deoxyphosphogluconate aldolase/(4S)-4-hydroxy-2-oxoglutarate aldolase
MDVLERIGAIGVVPVVEISDVSRARPLGDALMAGGLPCAEITFRTPVAAEVIEALRRECPGILVGAGTLTSPEQVDAAIGAGAGFLVSPGFNSAVVERALLRGMIIVPGVCTPTEIETALAYGLTVVKLFPAEIAGGVPLIELLAAPYSGVRFVPSGGINSENLARYLALPQVLACAGSWLVRRQLVDAGEFDAVRKLAAEAVSIVGTARSAGLTTSRSV